MQLVSIRHDWPEQSGFEIVRPCGTTDFVFLHFINSVYLTTQNGEIIKTVPGSLVVFSPGYGHSFKSDGPLVHNWMHLLGDIGSILSSFSLELNTVYTPSNDGFITSIMRELENEFFQPGRHSDEFIDMKISELFIKISRDISASSYLNEISEQTEKRFRDLRMDIFSHLNRQYTISELADSVGLSESRFHSIYKSIFGISPGKDIIIARISKSKDLLSARKYSVSQVAEMMGYTNEYHFIRQFKQITSVTPGAFMRRDQNMYRVTL